VLTTHIGKFPAVSKEIVPVLCNHCKDAPCVKACPAGASIQREDGIVYVDSDKCTGCRYCVIVCPYQHRSFFNAYREYFKGFGYTPPEELGRKIAPLEVGTVVKCTFCKNRLDEGLRKGLKPGVDYEATPACVIVKHANPCGVALGATGGEAWTQALACDPVSAFGGIVALNHRLDAATAEAITGIFTEVVIAPDADEAALAVFAGRKNLRLLLAGALPDQVAGGPSFRQVAGGFLVQDRDNGRLDPAALRVVTKRAPDPRELEDMLFAWKVAKHVKSNAIVHAKNGATIGIGAGQTSRVDSARIAAEKAGARARGAVVASDAFFPFADGLQAAIAAGAGAVIQPGGAMRDDEVIAAADAAGVAMVFTGQRHFRH